MRTTVFGKTVKAIAPFVTVCFLSMQLTAVLPRTARAGATDDLKQIEYKYYFRGNYNKAITELNTFLERTDLAPEAVVEAREYLAASLVMTGAAGDAKSQYVTLLKMDPTYPGPDPSVFKAIVVSTFNEAKEDYASAVLLNVPDSAVSGAATGATAPELAGKPFYKKWWFYVTVGAALLLVAGAAGGGDDGGGSGETGRVVVGVDTP